MQIDPFIQAKSDRLNADDLIGGDITVKIESVAKVSDEQPVRIQISGDRMPWHPCKTMLRVLADVYGNDTTKWVGHSVTLYRDPTVKWGGVEVGGIRIKALTGIESERTVSLTETRAKKKQHKILPLKAPKPQAPPKVDPDAPKVDDKQLAALETLFADLTNEQKAKARKGLKANLGTDELMDVPADAFDRTVAYLTNVGKA